MDKIQSLRNTIGGNYSKPKVSDMAMFRNQLSEYSVAMDYLRINRNLSDETIKSFMIGYDYYRNNIAIPESKNGELVNIGYRSLEQDPKIKYQKERGCENWIFNERALEIAKKKQGILIVSNQFDCMSAWQAGFENVVSVPVGKGSYGEWIELFDTIPKVYIAFENTKQSKKFALDLAERIGTDKSYEVIFPEDIIDCNHFFKQHDSNEFKDLIREARPFYKYKFQGLRDVIDSIKEKTDNVLKIKCIPYIEFEQDLVYLFVIILMQYLNQH
jgi:DNA primase